MSGFAFFPPQFTLVNSSGRPYAGAVARFYEAGTSTGLTVYTTAALSTAHGTSVTADASGVFPPTFVDPEGGDYKVSFFTSGGSLIRTVDNLPATIPLTAAQVGAALYPRTDAEVSASVTPSDYTYPPGDVRRYGAVLDGTTDDTAALQACADFCYASGVPMKGAEGTAKISSTLTLKCAGDLGMMTVRGPSTTVSPLVRVGTSTGSTLQLNGMLILPKVVNTTKPATGWASQQVGVELANLYQSFVTVPYVYGFAVGLDCGGYTSGFSYNTVNLLMLSDNKVSVRVQGKNASTGWANQNTFVGGRCFINSGEGSAISGARFIQLIPLSTGATGGTDWPNGNTFIGTAVEGNEPEYLIEIGGAYNTLVNCRYESTAPAVLWSGHASVAECAHNQIVGGYNASSITFTKSGVSVYNEILAPSKHSTGGTGVVWNMKNESSGDDPLIQGFDATVTADHLNAGTSATKWGVRLSATALQGKEKDDSSYRIKLDFATGEVHFTQLADYADDAAAATGGVAVGQLYRTGSAIKVRVS